jgi:hypothetical protein
MGVGGQHQTPTALPLGITRYPMNRRVGGLRGQCGRVWKISPLLEFDPRTVQPTASCYINYAIPAHC